MTARPNLSDAYTARIPPHYIRAWMIQGARTPYGTFKRPPSTLARVASGAVKLALIGIIFLVTWVAL